MLSERTVHERVVLTPERIARFVSEARPLLRGSDDVGEQHRPHAAPQSHEGQRMFKPGTTYPIQLPMPFQ